nr:MAG TPA: tail tube protein [Caudoviricetes sp.]
MLMARTKQSELLPYLISKLVRALLQNTKNFLAKWIEDIADDTDEATTSVAYYDGDGTEETTGTSVKGSYTFKGTYDKEDPAMKHIAGLKYKLGNERLVWHKIVDADGKNQAVGIATVSDIKAGSGAAAEYEEFSCKISYNSLPKISAVV